MGLTFFFPNFRPSHFSFKKTGDSAREAGSPSKPFFFSANPHCTPTFPPLFLKEPPKPVQYNGLPLNIAKATKKSCLWLFLALSYRRLSTRGFNLSFSAASRISRLLTLLSTYFSSLRTILLFGAFWGALCYVRPPSFNLTLLGGTARHLVEFAYLLAHTPLSFHYSSDFGTVCCLLTYHPHRSRLVCLFMCPVCVFFLFFSLST